MTERELKELARLPEDRIIEEASKDSTYCQLSVDIGVWAAKEQQKLDFPIFSEAGRKSRATEILQIIIDWDNCVDCNEEKWKQKYGCSTGSLVDVIEQALIEEWQSLGDLDGIKQGLKEISEGKVQPLSQLEAQMKETKKVMIPKFARCMVCGRILTLGTERCPDCQTEITGQVVEIREGI